jgi:hypothetical protein
MVVVVARYDPIMRSITAPFVVAPPAGARVRTRLRPSQQDAVVLRLVGEYLGGLAGGDLARRCALGPGADGRTDRKRALTPASSSRWAGAITRTSNDQWQRGWRNLLDARAGLRRASKAIEGRLQVPVGGRHGRVRGYPSPAERHEKQRRLQHLQARLARVERRLARGRVSVCRGGRRLAKARHRLAEAGLTGPQWRQRWTAERVFLTADGEADKPLGNETIRVHPQEGWLELKLPAPLAHLANTPHGRYRLSCPVRFTHRGGEWAAQVASGAVRYDIAYQPHRGRWYLSASWTRPTPPAVTVQQAVAGGVLAVDLNAGHLACWQIDRHGNPGGAGINIPLVLEGLPAATRDGRLRGAISRLLNLAQQRGCSAVGIEDLDFADARQAGRETFGRGRRGKRFRRTVAGIPTAQFRDRLAQMAANRGIAVVAIDPGWTSKWGRGLLAAAPPSQVPTNTDHPAPCRLRGAWASRARAEGAATARCARTPPEDGSRREAPGWCGELPARPRRHPGACRARPARHPPWQQPGVAEDRRRRPDPGWRPGGARPFGATHPRRQTLMHEDRFSEYSTRRWSDTSTWHAATATGSWCPRAAPPGGSCSTSSPCWRPSSARYWRRSPRATPTACSPTAASWRTASPPPSWTSAAAAPDW